MNRTFTFLLVGLMSLFSGTQAFAAATSGSCGESVTWEYDQASKILTISGEGDMAHYESPNYLPWAPYKEEIVEVVIGENITSICDYAFYGCSALTTVQVEAWYPPACGIIAFDDISPDATLTVPAGMKDKYQNNDGWSSFGDNIYEAEPLTGGFCGENAYWTYDDETHTLAITGTGAMRNYVNSDYLPWTYYQDEVKNLTISEGITTISDETFSQMVNLRSVSLPSTLESIGAYAFYESGIETITIPSHVTSIGRSAFYCYNLKTVIINAMVPPATERDIFSIGLIKIIVPDEALALYQNDEQWSRYFSTGDKCGDNATWVYNTDTRALIITGEGEMSDFDYALPWAEYIEEIEKVIVGEGITTIGNYAFKGATALTSVSLPSTLLTIGYGSFLGCTQLQSVTLPEGLQTIMTEAFENTGLTSIILPASIQEIFGLAFAECSQLVAITVNAANPIKIWPSTFNNINADATLTVPEGAEEAYKAAEWWEEFFFVNHGTCGENATWLFDKSTKTLYIAGEGAMEDYDSPYDIPWWKNFFHIIQHVVVGKGITYIGEIAFALLKNLEDVTIAETVTSIGSEAFGLSSNQFTITVEATTPPTLGEDVFYGTEDLTSIKLIVPAGSEDAYKAADGWKDLFIVATGIESIEATKTAKAAKPKVKKVIKNGRIYIGDYTVGGLRIR